MMIRIEKQFSIFLDNRPGTLSRTCQALAREGVNILALSISDTVDHAAIRMVTNDDKKAGRILQALHATVHERDVLLMDVPNRPGTLAEIAQKLAAAGINIEYAYCTASTSQEHGTMVLRTNDVEETINALS